MSLALTRARRALVANPYGASSSALSRLSHYSSSSNRHPKARRRLHVRRVLRPPSRMRTIRPTRRRRRNHLHLFPAPRRRHPPVRDWAAGGDNHRSLPSTRETVSRVLQFILATQMGRSSANLDLQITASGSGCRRSRRFSFFHGNRASASSAFRHLDKAAAEDLARRYVRLMANYVMTP